MKYIFILTILLSSNIAFSQDADNIGKYNEGNMYYESIAYYLQYLKKEKIPVDTFFVYDYYAVTDSLLERCNGMPVVKIKDDLLFDFLKRRTGIVVNRIIPVNFKDGFFYVQIVPNPCGYHKKTRRVHCGYGGGFLIRFSYDNGTFKFVDGKYYGI